MGEVKAKISFAHRRRRVMRHRRVVVDAIDFFSRGSEELAEDDKSPQMWGADNDRYSHGGEYVTADLQGAADAAAVRRGIEGGTDLVMNGPGAEFAHAREDGRQMRRHPLRRARPRIAAKPMAWQCAKRASCAGVGSARKSTLGTPLVASCSRTSVDPVKSSP